MRANGSPQVSKTMRSYFAGILAIGCLLACSKPVPVKEAPTDATVAVPAPIAPVATPAPALPTAITFKLVAGVVRGDGQVVPVARSPFAFWPYNMRAVYSELEARPGIPKVPESPKLACLDCKVACGGKKDYFKCIKACGECDGREMDAKEEQNKTEMDSWRKVAHEGLDALIAKKNPKGIKPQEFISDLKGEVVVTLEPGVWFIRGSATIGTSLITWDDVPITVKQGLDKFELSNDNGHVY